VNNGQVGNSSQKTFEKEQGKLFGRVPEGRDLKELAYQFGASRFIDSMIQNFDEALKDINRDFFC